MASPPPPTPDGFDRFLVTGLDRFILIIILVFSLFHIPRALAYIANNRANALQGYLLRASTQVRTYRPPRPPSPTTSEYKEGDAPEYSAPSLEFGVRHKQPWHFPMHFSLRHPAAWFLHWHALGNYTVFQLFLMAGYIAAVLPAVFYKVNAYTLPTRVGWVIISQIPFAYALATKNNAIGFLVGAGYEKLNYLHRHVGNLIVIGANVHAIGIIFAWSELGNVSQKFSQPFARWGLATLIALNLLSLFSTEYIRTNYYNIFLVTHTVGLLVVLIAVWNHQPVAIPFVIAAVVLYGLDHIVRLIKTRVTTATLRTIPEMGLTRVDVPSLTTGWRPGQHVRLRVLSTAMGLWGMTEVHPFTIASAINTEEGLVLMCKKTGDWTAKLYELAQTASSDEQGRRLGKTVRVMINGPYGGVGDTTVRNYSGAMFIAGGSGVTFALSAAQDLVLANDRSRMKVIEIAWSIADPGALEHFIPFFASLLSQSTPTSTIRVSVFYTRVSTRPFEEYALPPGMTLTPGRPVIKKLLDEFVTSVKSVGGTHGAFVGVCGPGGLSRDVSRALNMYDVDSKKTIGGFQLHEEVFGW